MKTESIGILNLDKPPGRTSRDVVNQVARLLPRKTKAGHAGTLDPMATGVLVVCIGSATRLIENIQRQGKTYRTVIRLGARSDTHDCDGVIVKTVDPRPASTSEVEAALATQRGEILQQPPEYSALKIDGRRAYDLARAGLPVDLAPRPVRIDRVELLSYEWPRLELEIDCGGGTYIRSIARDIGEILGCGALMDALVRTRIGPFTQESAVDPDELDRETLEDHLLPPVAALVDVPRITLDAPLVADVALGRKLAADRLADATIPPGEIALLSSEGDLVALGEAADDGLAVQPRKVFV